MNSSVWEQVFEIFEEAVELAEDDRDSFLDSACEDQTIRRAVEDMLEADREEGTMVIDRPVDKSPLAAETLHKEEGKQAVDPNKVGAYRLLRRIGQGGMSTVYLAVRDDDAFRRHVAVKLVRRGMESDAILQRLRTERQILAGLDHPYVARLYDGGSTEEGMPYFVMEHVDGTPIDAYCEHNQLSVDQRLRLFRKVCAAVRYAHQNLVVHRDIKPSNILVTADGSPKLLDFGIAKLLNPDLTPSEAEPTATWQTMMTPSYASPEQMRGKHITTASDVYSLGVLLYKLLSGRLPRSFKGRSPSEIERLLSTTDPVPPSTAVTKPASPGSDSTDPTEISTERAQERDHERAKTRKQQLAGDLDAIVLKALRSAPQKRYGSVERFAKDIERFQNGMPVLARAGTWRYRASKFVRRNRTAVGVASLISLLLAVFAGTMGWQGARVVRERDQARLERNQKEIEKDKKQQVLSLIFDIFEFSNPYVVSGEDLTVREALRRSVPVLEAGLHQQPDVRAELLYTSGSILAALEDFDVAKSQIEESLKIRRSLHGDLHADVVETIRVLASVLKNLGDLDAAEDLARQSIELARALGYDAGASPAGPLIELVSVLCYRGEFEAAESLAQEALALVRQVPEASVQEIRALEHLALISSTQGDYEEAAALSRKALSMLRGRYGEKHPHLIGSLNNLGLALRRQGEFGAADRTYQELLELQRESFGEDYKDPIPLNNLASLRFGQGDYSSAEKLYGQALEAVIESFGPEHPRVFILELSIEHSRIRQGASVEAERRIVFLLQRWGPRLGEDHWRIAQGQSILGESISTQGRCQEAEPLLVESFQQLLTKAEQRHRQDAFDRLRDHLERCGRPQDIARNEAMLADAATSQ